MKCRLLKIFIVCAMLASLLGTAFAASNGSTYIWPTDTHSLSRGFSNGHKGIDISVPVGTAVSASRGGTVYQVYTGCNNFSSPGTCRNNGACHPNVNFNNGTCNDGFGNGVIIKHSDGSYTAYAHLSPNSITVKNGDVVSQGQVIGKSGSSGNSQGPHLHFALLKASRLNYWPSYNIGNSVDPIAYLNGTGQSTVYNEEVTAVTTVADSITQTSAILRGSVSSSGVKLTQCGVLLGTSKQNMTKLGSDSINTYGTTCFYSTSKYGRTLTPGTTYYYQIYAVDANGKEYKGDTRSFTTALCTNHVKGKYLWYAQVHPHYDHYICSVCGQQFRTTTTNNVSSCKTCNPEPESCSHVKGKYLWFAAVHPHYNHYSCAKCGQTYREPETNFWHSCEICAPINAYGIRLSGLSTSGITANSVRLDASCAYTGSRPTSVGVYLGTSTSNMQIKGSDGNINHNKNPFSIWYNLSGLQPGTTYYYRFYAVVDGKVSFSEIKSFTTTK